MEKEIGRILKGEYQGNVTEIVVGVKEFNGRVGVDIREFSKSEQYTGPTKKGLRIPADKFEDFKKLVDAIKPEDLQAASQQSLPEAAGDSGEEKKGADSGMDEKGLM